MTKNFFKTISIVKISVGDNFKRLFWINIHLLQQIQNFFDFTKNTSIFHVVRLLLRFLLFSLYSTTKKNNFKENSFIIKLSGGNIVKSYCNPISNKRKRLATKTRKCYLRNSSQLLTEVCQLWILLRSTVAVKFRNLEKSNRAPIGFLQDEWLMKCLITFSISRHLISSNAFTWKDYDRRASLQKPKINKINKQTVTIYIQTFFTEIKIASNVLLFWIFCVIFDPTSSKIRSFIFWDEQQQQMIPYHTVCLSINENCWKLNDFVQKTRWIGLFTCGFEINDNIKISVLFLLVTVIQVRFLQALLLCVDF